MTTPAPTAGRPIRILVADDHVLLREALCDLLRAEADFEVCAEAGDGEEVLRLAARHRPDAVLLDIEMPRNEDPAATVRKLLQHQPELRVVVLSMHDDARLIQDLLAEGASGYLHKGSDRETLAAALRSRSDLGRRVVTISVSDRTLRANETAEAGPAARLSPREREVLDLVAAALSNRQIGARLGITEGTIKRHLRNIFDKLDAVSRLDAVNKALGSAAARPWAARSGGGPGPSSIPLPGAGASPVSGPASVGAAHPAPVLARRHSPAVAVRRTDPSAYPPSRFPASATARHGGEARRQYVAREREGERER
ncbi:response regulator transcription factor [Streptomyces sp. NPDC050610]|uniref:response regulator transcription factor n=1 Tax=Streptomyces sp. NPDC050610 TaxID=3157097 RepID=UPI00344845C7